MRSVPGLPTTRSVGHPHHAGRTDRRTTGTGRNLDNLIPVGGSLALSGRRLLGAAGSPPLPLARHWLRSAAHSSPPVSPLRGTGETSAVCAQPPSGAASIGNRVLATARARLPGHPHRASGRAWSGGRDRGRSQLRRCPWALPRLRWWLAALGADLAGRVLGRRLRRGLPLGCCPPHKSGSPCGCRRPCAVPPSVGARLPCGGLVPPGAPLCGGYGYRRAEWMGLGALAAASTDTQLVAALSADADSRRKHGGQSARGIPRTCGLSADGTDRQYIPPTIVQVTNSS